MKILGGEWSRGDAIAIIGVLVAVVGSVAAVLAIPGMPKFLHLDSESAAQTPKTGTPPPVVTPVRPALKAVSRTKDVTSGQVNFGCEQSIQVETPAISFGLNPRNVDAQPAWMNMDDHVKSHNQSTANVEDSATHNLVGIKAVGSITGLDSQSIFGVKNCPGGGHGELTLHASWTEDQP